MTETMTDTDPMTKLIATITEKIALARNSKRKIRNPNRYKDDGTYDNKPLDPNYFRTYYHTKGSEQVECPTCGYQCKRNYLYRHSKTDKCIKQAIRQAENEHK